MSIYNCVINVATHLHLIHSFLDKGFTAMLINVLLSED